MAKELLKGNHAFAEAAIRAGVEAFYGYPITPSTEFLEYMARRLPSLGRAFVQAESEGLYRETSDDGFFQPRSKLDDGRDLLYRRY